MKPEIRIPDKGRSKKDILAALEQMKAGDVDFRHGRVWSLVYHGGARHEQLMREVYGLFIAENYLSPLAFKSLKQMETEVVAMTANLLHGGPEAVGTMTTGGTESILMAVKAARDRARARKPWIRRPEVVGPKSLHVAFRKACHYLGLRFVEVPLDENYRCDLRALGRRISRNTVLIAASAPQFPQGMIDPIESIGELARRRKIPFHVDACVGGFLLPWLEAEGVGLPAWDFRVPGVTSMSADVHKYGLAAKGASVICYRNMDYLKHQFYVCTNWSGGVYASPAMPGTRPGGSIATAWASLMGVGVAGFRQMARDILAAQRQLTEGIRSIEGLRLVCQPDAPLVAFTSRESGLDIYAVADQLQARGWHPDRQQDPNSIHVTVMAHHLPVIGPYLADLRAAVEHVRAHPELSNSGEAAMYGMMAKVPVRGMVKLAVRKVMEAMYAADGGQPDLAQLGTNDDKLLQLMDRYGPQALELFDKANQLRRAWADRIGDTLGRWTGRDR
jgi:glutamate/tyrosine decarboxylase-like PLP-dependent enzyme